MRLISILSATAVVATLIPLSAGAQIITDKHACMGPTIGDKVITTAKGEMLTLRSGGIADLVTLSGQCLRLGINGVSAGEAIYQDRASLINVTIKKDGTLRYSAARDN